jgi:hypothetical protein
MDQAERRVRQLAEKLWRDAGRPESGSQAYLGRAGELIAIKDNQALTTRKLAPSERAGVEGDQTAASSGPTGEPVEPLEAVENLGDFPTLTDQGEEQTTPHRRGPRQRRRTLPRNVGRQTERGRRRKPCEAQFCRQTQAERAGAAHRKESKNGRRADNRDRTAPHNAQKGSARKKAHASIRDRPGFIPLHRTRSGCLGRLQAHFRNDRQMVR